MGAVVNQIQSSSVSPLFVGIDVSGEFLDVACHESTEYFRVTNSPEGIADLINRLLPLKPQRVVLEATGKLERAVLEALCQAGLPAVAVNPKWVRDFAKSTGRLAKTDRIDARVIAHYGAAVKPAVRPLNDEQTQQLQALILRRAQLIEMLTAEQNRRKRAHRAALPSIDELIRFLQQRIKDADHDIDTFLRSNELWCKTEALLRSAPGIGRATAATLIAFLPELGTLSGRQIASLVGLAPFNVDSGSYQGQRHIKGGRHIVRRALYMACVAAQRANPQIKAFCDQLRARGKKTKVAFIAGMRKLLTQLNAMMRDAIPWNPPKA
ncbi:IS110 family transposase [Paraburkholderia sp. CNPSo 3272]|uniref:IS110 family transposase n=1 Tax=Paraburkholderia sp. CNPSo 3272 TaxID=2940931 RepID=UPI0020B7A271|nr:IS110 family transposase [Paraburkholderia sp. CNPSo 3272]MCP3728779.1 IS110 family transposase [Paraburkholderia sp. CNPSo 3272]